MKNLHKPPMKNLKPSLKQHLKDKLSGAAKVVILGIGSELCGDDSAGMVLVRELEKSVRPDKGGPEVLFLAGSTAPENFTGDIKKFRPTHLVMVDCADMGIKPGEAIILDPDEAGGISFSTHRMPLSIMIRYLRIFIDCEMILIGIQPRSLKFGSGLSREAEEAVSCLTGALCGIFNPSIRV